MKKTLIIQPRAAGKNTEHKVLRALLKNDGRSFASIGKDVGLSRARVSQLAKKHGITRRVATGVLMVDCQHCGKPTPAVPTIR
jgi:hypothetical protein